MAEKPRENGVGGYQYEGEEEEEEEDQSMPRLKYQRMGGSVPVLMASDAISCTAVAERMIALGTHRGSVHLLDFLGNQVKEFPAHTGMVNDLCFDIEGEYIGSCSDDGSVVINEIFSQKRLKFDYHHPMKVIALDPYYAKNSSRRFVAGGLAGAVYLSTKSLIRYFDKVLHCGEGPIRALKWRSSLIAWANDAGVKVYDASNNCCIIFIGKPPESPCPELLHPHLVWKNDTDLVIGWGTTLILASLRTDQNDGSKRTSLNQVGVVASFETTDFISGIAPIGDTLIVLAYNPSEGGVEKNLSSNLPSPQFTASSFSLLRNAVNPQVSELRVVKWKLDGHGHCNAKDYSLAHAPFSGNSYADGQWAPGDEPLYYIVSPKDVVIAKRGDVLQVGWHEKALDAVEAVCSWRGKFYNGKRATFSSTLYFYSRIVPSVTSVLMLVEVGSGYLDHLIAERKYAEAASLCPKLLRGSISAWEIWIIHFAHLHRLHLLIPHIPTENPRLCHTIYQIALLSLAMYPCFHKDLLSTVKSWPPVIYSAHSVISAIEPQLNDSSMTDALKEAMAELYALDGQYEKALAYYVDLSKPDIFVFIEKHNIRDAINDKVVQLMMISCKRATSLLMQHINLIPPSEVVSKLTAAIYNSDCRKYLHLYLHSLFVENPQAGRDYHDIQVELYADYDSRMLLPFLRSSQHYTLQNAYEICVSRDLLREQVFILGRMGNSKEALAVIINKIGDLEEALDFLNVQQVDDLWEELLKLCLDKPEMVGTLMEHSAGNLDPFHIVKMLPNGLEIPRLRDRIFKIITDYRTEITLRQCFSDILKADIVNLLIKHHKEAKRAIYFSNEENETRAKRDETQDSQIGDGALSTKSMEIIYKARGGGRCCICFDPFQVLDVDIVAFFCCHAYHTTCLMDSIDSLRSTNNAARTSPTEVMPYYEHDENGGMGGDDTKEETASAAPPWCCILCSTATAA